MNQMMVLRRHDGIDRYGDNRIDHIGNDSNDEGDNGVRKNRNRLNGEPVRLGIDLGHSISPWFWILTHVQTVRVLLIAFVLSAMVTIVLL